MPEIVQRDQVTKAGAPHFDSIIASRGRIGAPYQYLLHSPDLAARVAHTIGFARFEANLDRRVSEIAICAVAREMDCLYEWAAHEGDARTAGVAERTIQAIKTGVAPEGIDAGDAAIVSYVQALLRPPHRASDAMFSGLYSHFGERDMAELTAVIGAYAMLACCLNAFDVQTPEGRPVLPV